MSSLPGIPPPCPPPPLNVPSASNLTRKNGRIRLSSQGFQLPAPVVELRQACKTAGLTKQNTDGSNQNLSCCFLCHYQQVAPLIQDGPKCGLVALCMASQLVCEKAITVDDLFSLCKKKGYTQQGEMFSAAAMCEAAKTVCGCDVNLIQDVTANQDLLINHLMQGLPVVFPYDADRNNGPGIREGKAAHWAVFTGVVMESCMDMEEIEKYYVKDPEGGLYHLRNKDIIPSLNSLGAREVYVCSRQGKSNYMRLWKFRDMIKSSCQMYTVSPEVMLELHSKILPDSFESLQLDLANKAVCLNMTDSIT